MTTSLDPETPLTLKAPTAKQESMMKCKILGLFIFLASSITTYGHSEYPKDSGGINSHNVTLLSLYSIHETFLDFSCDTIIPTNIILSIVHEHVVNIVNEEVLKGTGILLNSKFVDTCNNASVTLQNIVSAISNSHVFCQSVKDPDKGDGGNSTTAKDDQPDSTSYEDGKLNWYPGANDKLDPMLAATGAFSGEIGVNVNYLLGAFCLPVISSKSSSAELDNPSTYPYFLRSGASDIYRTQVIFDILQSQQWYHIDLIYDSSSFGVAMMNEFKNVVDYCDGTDFTDTSGEKIFRSPCVENYFELSLSGDNVNDDTLEKELGALVFGLNSSSARVIVILMEDGAAEITIPFLETLGYTMGGIQLILPSRHITPSDLVEYAFAIEEDVAPYLPLQEILTEKSLLTTTNEWIIELIEENNLCCWNKDIGDCSYSMTCNGTEKIKKIPSDAQLEARHVYNAIMVIASSLKKLHDNYCEPNEGLCKNFIENYTGSMMLQYLLNASFVDDNGKNFSIFNRASEPVYNVFQYHGGKWHLVLKSYNPYVGAVPSEETEDIVQIPIYKGIQEELEKCQSTCERSIPDILTRCCWNCRFCGAEEFVNATIQMCQNCSIDEIPNLFLNGCVSEPVPPIFYDPAPEMYVLIGFSALGILLTILLIVYMYNKKTTPMVMASTPDLCYIQAVTQVLLFVVTIFMLPTSSIYICGAAWTVSTTLLLITHAVFLIKAIRLSRPRFYTRLISYTNTPLKSSVVMLVAICFGQLLICIIWVLLRPPTVTRTSNHLKYCSSNDEIQTTVLMILPMSLVIWTLYFQKNAIRNKIMFQVRQARIGLAGTLCFIVNYAILLPLIFMEDSPQNVKSTILMCIPLLTAYVSWTTMLLPVAYELFIRKKQNSHEYVSRERSRQFQAGNIVYYVDAMVVNRASRTRTQTADSIT
ncbi:hypothetical protein FO519_001161 [Halicephalobus sp. NKZ332]|nr:hypothetical protein FO519_001161 [Halicephalobus sp. NKZ332]